MTIDAPIAWGRTLAEYRAMFALGARGHRVRVLDCAAGPASFVAEWCAGGGRAVACDPLYARGAAEIAASLGAAEAMVREHMAREAARFVWRSFADLEALVAARRTAGSRFVADLVSSHRAGRYLAGALPLLPFRDRAFDLALCSHFFLLYSAAFDLAFHRAALAELLRVADEVRVFPLLAMDGMPSPHLEPLLAELRRLGHQVALRRVDYEVMRGGDRMLLVRREDRAVLFPA